MDRAYRRYCLLALAGIALASSYPLYMGARVLLGMARDGAIPIADYPKYIIPYTPVCLALIMGTILIPILNRFSPRRSRMYGTAVSLAVFFIAERYLETSVLVRTEELIPLESWQMSLCYQPPENFVTRTWEAVNVLLGGYSPAFKLHFYLISCLIIVAWLNCLYGCAGMFLTGERRRKKALGIQAVSCLVFTGMCVWACFTSFYRTGELTVSPLSAVLMALFFIAMGVTAGAFAASLTMGKRKALSETLPVMTAVVMTCLMYAGEMILLNGSLYRFGNGFLFGGLGPLVLAPIDLMVILAAGAVTYAICRAVETK